MRGILLLAIVLAIVAVRIREWRVPAPPERLEENLHRIERVVDGDTLVLVGGARVRLLGIDSPESVKPDHPVEPWSQEAAQFAREFLRGGEARLAFDRERKDRFGRFLAYVYVGDRMLNEELVLAGLARAMPQYRYSDAMKRRFRVAEEEAKAARRGIWSE